MSEISEVNANRLTCETCRWWQETHRRVATKTRIGTCNVLPDKRPERSYLDHACCRYVNRRDWCPPLYQVTITRQLEHSWTVNPSGSPSRQFNNIADALFAVAGYLQFHDEPDICITETNDE